jgi:hypothetical protein
MQASQFVLVSFTLSLREGDLPAEYLLPCLNVLKRYAMGVFSETGHMATENGDSSLWAATSLERGLTANRLHVQGAAMVCLEYPCMPKQFLLLLVRRGRH